VTIPAGTVTGTYYVIARADADDLIVEVNEANNTKTSGLIKIGPDLIVSVLTVPSTAGAGTSITVTDTTKNSGAGDAGSSTTSFYLSTDTTFDVGDALIGSRTAGSIAAGASSQGSTSVSIPAGTASGAYYIIARADDGNTVPELNEDNNTLFKGIAIGPDLTMTTVSVPTAAGAGTVITVNDVTKNNGPGSTEVSITRFYLSTDTTFDGSDVFLGSRSVPVLSAGATSSGATSVTIPAGTVTGTYYVIARADADDLIVEVNEINNTKFSGLIKIGPDLIVSSVNAPSTAGAGTSITVTDTTKNSGAGDAGSSTTSFYLSTDTTFDAGDALIGSRVVGAILVGATDQGTTSVAIPAGTAAGTYYIISKADADNVVAEIIEDNNTYMRPIKIGQ
jgi:subtilase family serine protease